MEWMTVVLATTAISGLYLAWNIGANDVANAMGTSVGSGALTLRNALIVAAVCELAGALLVGGTVTQTISGGIVPVGALGTDPHVIAIGMTGCLIAAAIWLHVATYVGWPVSTTHSVVGAMLGFGLWAGGFDAVRWSVVARIVASWLLSPALGGIIAYLTFRLIRTRVLNAENPPVALRLIGPWLVWPLFTLLAMAVMDELHLPWPGVAQVASAALIALVGTVLFRAHLRRIAKNNPEPNREKRTERVFLALQVVTAAFMAFAHGSNDIANAVGPMAAVFSAVREGLQPTVEVPTNLLAIGAFGIVLGLGTYGYKVMATIGREITHLTPSRGFAAEFGAALTIVVASDLGLPISTTHTLVGAVIGVGFARSLGALNLRVIRGIAASWLITVPFTALLSILLTMAGVALL